MSKSRKGDRLKVIDVNKRTRRAKDDSGSAANSAANPLVLDSVQISVSGFSVFLDEEARV